MGLQRPVATAALVAVALLLVLGAPTDQPSPAGEGIPPAPSLQELHLLQELAQWLGDGPIPVPAATGDLTGAVRSRRHSFELFRRFKAREDHREVLHRLPHGRLIQAAAEEAGLDGLLVAAVVSAESRFDPEAVSPRGAQGLMQLMPDTAASFGLADPQEPAANLRAGARYLRQLLEHYHGDLEMALAAYNAGPGAVARHGGVPPYPETLRYVDQVLATYVSYHRRLWGDSEVAELLRTVTVTPEGGSASLALAAASPAL
jgi:soluble lytic murein transglycosylase-like protein